MLQPYQVMARRWRPQTFEEVCGQPAVVRTLRNALAGGRLPHALLFAGPRGVGKTTTARLLAKALNCAQGPTPHPCGACEPCRAVQAGRQLNVLEIDGASHNRVEEARDLIETVQYAAGEGKWRVVIVDEVHMLSTAAFNALLKTLEEPPPHVVFVLATTEPQKVPATIHSRCQRHDFRRLTPHEIVASLSGRLREEGLEVGEEALRAIARAAQGSLRDAQSLLEQAMAFAGGPPSPQDVEAGLGLVGADRLVALMDALLARTPDRALALVDGLHREGHDLRLLCQEMVAYLRDLAVARACPAPEPLLEDSRAPGEILQRQAAGVSLAEIELMQRALLQAEAEMRRAAAPRLALEMAILRAGEIRVLEPVPALVARLRDLERRLGGPSAAAEPPQPAGPMPRPPAELPLFAPPSPGAARATGPASPAGPPLPAPPGPPPAPPAPGTPGPPADAAAAWRAARRRLEARKRLAVVLVESEAVLRGDTLEVRVSNGSAFVRQILEDPEARRAVAEAVRQAFGRALQVMYRYGQPGGAAADHPAVRQALEIFEGRLVPAPEAPAGTP